MNTLAQAITEFKTVEMNADSDYASSFGIEKGDVLFLTGFGNAVEGDLLLCHLPDGRHDLDTYNEAFTNLENGSYIGVLVGCFKTFKERAILLNDSDWPEIIN